MEAWSRFYVYSVKDAQVMRLPKTCLAQNLPDSTTTAPRSIRNFVAVQPTWSASYLTTVGHPRVCVWATKRLWYHTLHVKWILYLHSICPVLHNVYQQHTTSSSTIYFLSTILRFENSYLTCSVYRLQFFALQISPNNSPVVRFTHITFSAPQPLFITNIGTSP